MKRATELLLGFSLVMGLTCEILTTPAISQEIKREATIEAAKKEGKLQIYALLVVWNTCKLFSASKRSIPSSTLRFTERQASDSTLESKPKPAPTLIWPTSSV